MARETATQRKSRISALLADYDARNRELNKLTTIVKGLRAQVSEIDSGTYGEWALTRGAGREMLDQQAAKNKLTELGVEIPTFTTKGNLIVTPTAAK